MLARTARVNLHLNTRHYMFIHTFCLYMGVVERVKLAVGVCCCLQICNSGVNMVMGLLRQGLMVISTTGILLLCKSILHL